MLKATAKNVHEVIARFAEFIADEDKEIRQNVADAMNEMLDEFLSNDLFGTEGQLDPRGDQRD